MKAKIDSYKIVEGDEGRRIDTSVDFVDDDGRTLAFTWVEIPYDENLNMGKIQEIASMLAREKIKELAKRL